ncbi:MAG: hypothetical protein R3251_01485 [Candidatus Spechtbacterales bacterium]|nr:hypothetical protein [Candidatus Spechtbacterales bacterium]
MTEERKEQDLDQRHAQLVLRYEDIRATMKGLLAILPERHIDMMEEMLKDTKTSTRRTGNLEKRIEKLELNISILEHFLFGMREALTGDHQPVITNILSTSENPSLALAAIGTDPKQ